MHHPHDINVHTSIKWNTGVHGELLEYKGSWGTDSIQGFMGIAILIQHAMHFLWNNGLERPCVPTDSPSAC
jgi:hypothetical protein